LIVVVIVVTEICKILVAVVVDVDCCLVGVVVTLDAASVCSSADLVGAILNPTYSYVVV